MQRQSSVPPSSPHHPQGGQNPQAEQPGTMTILGRGPASSVPFTYQVERGASLYSYMYHFHQPGTYHVNLNCCAGGRSAGGAQSQTPGQGQGHGGFGQPAIGAPSAPGWVPTPAPSTPSPASPLASQFVPVSPTGLPTTPRFSN